MREKNKSKYIVNTISYLIGASIFALLAFINFNLLQSAQGSWVIIYEIIIVASILLVLVYLITAIGEFIKFTSQQQLYDFDEFKKLSKN